MRPDKPEESRQTDFSFEQIMEMLKISGGERCFLLNEMGIIFWCGGKDGAKAEAFLQGCLESQENEDKALAFCYLSTAESVAQKTKEKLERFKSDPTNKVILDWAKKAIAQPRLI